MVGKKELTKETTPLVTVKGREKNNIVLDVYFCLNWPFDKGK